MVHKLVSSNLCTIFVLILSPRLNADFIELHGAERLDEGAGQTTVGDERHVQVDGCTTDLIAVGELA